MHALGVLRLPDLKVSRDNGLAAVRRRSWAPHAGALATELARGKHERREES